MKNKRVAGAISLSLSLTMLASGSLAQGGRMVTVPVGTVVPLRMETYLSSEASQVGDSFQATVFRDVEIDGRLAIPADSKIEGRVSTLTKADRKSKAGTLGVAFERLLITGRRTINVDATLTTLDEAARAKLETADEEGKVAGGSQKRRAVIFIGGGAGAGAIIGAVAGGGKGAAVGAGIGAVLGTIGTLLGKGDDAEVKPGTEFGMLIERAFSVEADSRAVAQADFTGGQTPGSSDLIQAAQVVLRDRGYYSGQIDGRLNTETRSALRQFQRDRSLAASGELNQITAKELGILDRTGTPAVLIPITAPRAEWVDRGSIRVQADAHTQGLGWRTLVDHFVTQNTLHVYIRGVRPDRIPSGQTQHHRIDETISEASGVQRVLFHGPDRDFTVEPGGGAAAGGNGTGDTQQIALVTNRLLASYQRDLGVRTARNELYFDARRDFRPGEVELLFQISTLATAADLYNQLVGRVRDQEAIKDAADSLLRQARFVNRLLRRHDELNLSRPVRSDWDLLRSELRRITITPNDIDTDIDRIR